MLKVKQCNAEMRRKYDALLNGGVASSSRSRSTIAGSVLAVRDQDGADYDNEMRRKYAVCLKPLLGSIDNIVLKRP